MKRLENVNTADGVVIGAAGEGTREDGGLDGEGGRQ